MTISELYLPEFDAEIANTRKLLEALPETLTDFKPHEKSMAFNRLAGHVAQIPGWAKRAMTTESMEMDPTKFTPFLPKTKKEVLEEFEKNAKDGHDAIAGGSDKDFAVIWSLTGQGKTFLSMPRSGIVRTVCMNHLIHHRAQLGVYMRLQEEKIPGMYGPSADEMGVFGPKK